MVAAAAEIEDIPDDLIAPAQAARLLHCTPGAVREMIRSGRLRAWQRGGTRYLVSEADVRLQLVQVEPRERAAPVREGKHPNPKVEAAREHLRSLGYKV